MKAQELLDALRRMAPDPYFPLCEVVVSLGDKEAPVRKAEFVVRRAGVYLVLIASGGEK